MVKLYSGTPGSGKSLHTAERIFYALRAGRPVICNFDINLSFVQGKRRKKNLDFTYLPNDQLTVAALQDFSASYFKDRPVKEEKILLVIDEAQLIFNAREWDARGRKDWLSFFTQHRKYGYEIVLVAQFDRMLDRQIRSLIEYEYIHRKVCNFGLKGWLLSFFVLGRLFVAVEVWYPMKERVGAQWFVCKRRFFRLYDTFKDFGKSAPTAVPLGVFAETVPQTEADDGAIDVVQHAKFYEVS